MASSTTTGKSSIKGKRALHGAVLTVAQTPDFSTKVKVFPSMVVDIVAGKWGAHVGARRKLFLAALVALYVVSPLDFFPEAIFFIPGLLDDVALSLFATSTMLNLAEEYVENENLTQPAEPVRAHATRLG